MRESTYYSQIDALKGIAIFLVVLGHSIILYPVNLHENIFCEALYQWLSSVHMPLFFIVSGFCFSYHYKYTDYLRKKVRRILIPYVFFNMLDIVPRAILGNFINRPRSISESIINVLLYGGEYWFLYTLFIIFLIYPLFYHALSTDSRRYIVFIIVLIAIYLIAPDITILTCSEVVYYSIYFSIGALLKNTLNEKVFENALSKQTALLLSAILLLLWIALMPFKNTYTSILIALVGVMTFYFLSKSTLFVNAFKGFGTYSLQLYLLNGFLLVISRTIAVSILGISNPLIIILFNMIIDFWASYIFIKYICTKFKITRTLMGIV